MQRRSGNTESLAPPPPPKTKIGERLTTDVDATEVVGNRSPDLIPLTKDYEEFKKKLRALIVAAQDYQDITAHLERSRNEVRKVMFSPIIVHRTHIHTYVHTRHTWNIKSYNGTN